MALVPTLVAQHPHHHEGLGAAHPRRRAQGGWEALELSFGPQRDLSGASGRHGNFLPKNPAGLLVGLKSVTKWRWLMNRKVILAQAEGELLPWGRDYQSRRLQSPGCAAPSPHSPAAGVELLDLGVWVSKHLVTAFHTETPLSRARS